LKKALAKSNRKTIMNQMRKINFPLSNASRQKIRKLAKETFDLPRNTSNEKLRDITRDIFGVRTYAQADNILVSIYNERVDAKNENKKTIKKGKPAATIVNENKKQSAATVSRFLRNAVSKRRTPVLVESTFKSYWRYVMESFFRRDSRSADSRITVDEAQQYAERVYTFLAPIVAEKLRELHFIKVYVVQVFIKSGDGLAPFNFGGISFTKVPEFREYFINKFTEYFLTMDESYGELMGFGDTEINILKFTPMQGGSYQKLPPAISNSKSIINIKNEDEKCFLWSCIASRHLPTKNAERMSNYLPFANEFKCSEEDFPMKITKIPRFEKANAVNINVYGCDGGQADHQRIPLYISKGSSEEVINLFFHEQHYSLIKNFQRFVGGDHNFCCPNCLKGYRSKEAFDRHTEVCKELNANGSLITTPAPGTTTKFVNYRFQKRAPVILIADFEASLEATNSVTKNGKVAEKSYIKAAHKANSFRLFIESDVPLDIPLEYSYVGEDADYQFIKRIVDIEKSVTKTLLDLNQKNRFPPRLERAEYEAYLRQKECIFCNKPFEKNETDERLQRVRDHCHFTNKFCGAAHKMCNLKASQVKYGKVDIPCFFHNANYDIRSFINAFNQIVPEDGVKKIGGVPTNLETFKCLSLNNITIKDSYAHMSDSLAKLIKLLPEEKKIRLRSIVGNDETKYELINAKGHYPYEFVDSIAKLDTPLSELRREHFDSKLRQSKITEEEWEHVQKVIRVFDFKTLREYHDLYLRIDVLGLADVMASYRDVSIKANGLDPVHYMGLPGFSWDAGLKFTGVELENISDLDMFMAFEKLKRGGISVISKRYAKANNQYLPDYNPSMEKVFLEQPDCNNLYGKAMCAMLPTRGFKWIPPEEFDLDSYDASGNKGYVLEVDLEYPSELHDAHNDYPLAPEHMELNGHRKLAPNLNGKTKYMVYIDNLLFYQKEGMVLTKIHRVIGFEREAWLKPYIDKNTALRQATNNEFEKDYYKLLNNAFYGKTMENERDRVNINFCMDAKSFQKHTSSPLFANRVMVIKEDGLALVQSHKKEVILKKPIYSGGIVLEISKLIMFDFHYNVMKKVYPDCEMMKTDTDSLLYKIKTDDLYHDLKTNPLLQQHFEFSNFPDNHPLYNCDRKKLPGLFQDECTGDKQFKVISEYVGLRAKSYVNKLFNVTTGQYEDKMKSKGAPSLYLKKQTTFENYRACNFEKKNHTLQGVTSFRSFGLRTYTVEQSKLALGYTDDKRVMCDNMIDTFAHGHYLVAGCGTESRKVSS
jgi:hypothetical protein